VGPDSPVSLTSPVLTYPSARFRTLRAPSDHLQHPLYHGSSTSDAPPDPIQRRTKPERNLGTRSLHAHALSRGPTPTPTFSQWLIRSDESVHTVTLSAYMRAHWHSLRLSRPSHATTTTTRSRSTPPKDDRKLENRGVGFQRCHTQGQMRGEDGRTGSSCGSFPLSCPVAIAWVLPWPCGMQER
jgi:hypothetical protein